MPKGELINRGKTEENKMECMDGRGAKLLHVRVKILRGRGTSNVTSILVSFLPIELINYVLDMRVQTVRVRKVP